MSDWTTAAELREQVLRRWDKGELLAHLVAPADLFPLRLVLRAPRSAVPANWPRSGPTSSGPIWPCRSPTWPRCSAIWASASRHFSANSTSPGTPAVRRRGRSSAHARGR